MKRFFGTIILLASIGSYAQMMHFDSYGSVHIDGELTNFANQKLYMLNTNIQQGKIPLDSCEVDENGKFEWKTSIPFSDYFVISFGTRTPMNIILRAGDSISIKADPANINDVKFERSKDSQLLADWIKEFSEFKVVADSLKRQAQLNPGNVAQIDSVYKPIAEAFVKKRTDFIKKHSDSPALIGTLASFDQKNEWKAYTEVVRYLNESFVSSPTIKQVNNYVLQKNAQIEAEKKANEMFQPGKMAPEISLPGFDGDTIKLSDLRGKVVLIDFWASWCKPCRMENPNVVNNYKKYNEKGFEVFSVSLDKGGQAARWKQAVEQDGLIWPYHVSDLKGWQSIVTKTYNVKSIPFTVLIDQEGKIIGTNFRGPKLEQELKKVFGA